MSSVAEDELNHYLSTTRNVYPRLLTDPAFKLQAETLRSALILADAAMGDEGIAEEVRRRIVRAVLYGERGEGAAVARLHEQAAPGSPFGPRSET